MSVDSDSLHQALRNQKLQIDSNYDPSSKGKKRYLDKLDKQKKKKNKTLAMEDRSPTRNLQSFDNGTTQVDLSKYINPTGRSVDVSTPPLFYNPLAFDKDDMFKVRDKSDKIKRNLAQEENLFKPRSGHSKSILKNSGKGKSHKLFADFDDSNSRDNSDSGSDSGSDRSDSYSDSESSRSESGSDSDDEIRRRDKKRRRPVYSNKFDPEFENRVDIVQEKIKYLAEIAECSKLGVLSGKEWSLNDTFFDLRIESIKLKDEKLKQSQIDQCEQVILMGAKVISEYHQYVPVLNRLKLKGYHAGLSAISFKLRDCLKDIYEEDGYLPHMPPKAWLAFTLAHCAGSVHVAQEGCDAVHEENKRKREQQAQERAQNDTQNQNRNDSIGTRFPINSQLIPPKLIEAQQKQFNNELLDQQKQQVTQIQDLQKQSSQFSFPSTSVNPPPLPNLFMTQSSQNTSGHPLSKSTINPNYQQPQQTQQNDTRPLITANVITRASQSAIGQQYLNPNRKVPELPLAQINSNYNPNGTSLPGQSAVASTIGVVPLVSSLSNTTDYSAINSPRSVSSRSPGTPGGRGRNKRPLKTASLKDLASDPISPFQGISSLETESPSKRRKTGAESDLDSILSVEPIVSFEPRMLEVLDDQYRNTNDLPL